ncbi:MAG: hypothetical protein J6R29_04300 [Clostridia bacterium]|nr:hypothetical protein [Clostridia bacterium]
MRTREESLNNFTKLVGGLVDSNYLLANSKIFEVITAVNTSKLLTEMFKYFTDGFNFEEVLTNCFIEVDGEKKFVLPVKNTDVLALVYLILREINFKNLQLTDLLEYFDSAKNYELAFKAFGEQVLLPFKTYVYQVGRVIINSTQTKSEAQAVNQESEQTDGEIPPTTAKSIESEETVETAKLPVNLRLIRLLELDRLSIVQSRLTKEDKNELLYVLNLFGEEIKKGDSEKINLAYLAYFYALKPYRRIRTNVKEITAILFNEV